ncbi:MAG TPA: ABC transporter permease [Terriglobales bacterium]|nr:ABC transporter permease [Terriglobales bacterium]
MKAIRWFWQDLHYGLRGLRNDLPFALLAVFALALGIGATTVIFSVIDAVVLEPFPYRDAGNIVRFYIHDNSKPGQEGRADLSMAEFAAFRDQNHVFSDMIAGSGLDVLYTDKQGTKQFRGFGMTPNMTEFLGVKAIIGRGLVPDDARPDAPPVAVMSYHVWQREFHSDPNLIGSLLTISGKQTTLVGIMPPRFRYGSGDFWLPMMPNPADTNPFHHVGEMARLKPGVSLEAAANDLDVIAHRLAKIYPKQYPNNFRVKTWTLTDSVVHGFRITLFLLLGAVGMLLLIACSNVANLLLARATAREREIAIRASMGASRTRIVTQLLVESFLLATLGCLAGWVFAYVGLKGLVATIPPELVPSEAVIRLNLRVLAFAIGATLVTTLLCGIAPALHAVRGQLHDRLKSATKGASGGHRQNRVRFGLVISQVALSLVLLVGAGLMMRTLFALEHVDLGFTPDHVLSARTPLPPGRYQTAEQKRVFFRTVLQRIAALPGVISATETSTLPPYGGIVSELTIPGKLHANMRSLFQLCSEDYFKTIGIRLAQGRLFDESEVEAARHLIVVNQTLARDFFGKDNPIGRSIKFDLLDTLPESPHDAYFQIIGVTVDERNMGLQQAPIPEAFLPYSVTGDFARGLLVRTAVDPVSLLPSVQREVWAVDPGVALTLTGSLDDYLQQFTYAGPRFGLVVFGIFAGIGLALVTIGIFSVMAYSVSLETREIGIRMALGAQQGTVLKMVLVRGLTIIAIGIAIGEVVSIGLTRLLQSQIWGVSARDPVTFCAVLGLLAIVGLMACLLPARRATQVDPLVALRYE